MKKAALGLAIALAMGTAIACTPAKQQGTMDNNTYSRYGGPDGYFYQDGTEYLHGYGTTREKVYNYNAPGTTRDGVGPGMYNNRAYGTRPGGTLFGGYDGTRMNGGRDLGTGTNDMVNNANRVNTTDQRLAQRLSQRINNIPGVNQASVVVHENNVLVGIDTTSNNVDNLVNQVRREVEKEANGKQVHVSADRDLYTRINNLNQQNRNQHPVRNLGNDVQRIIADIGSTVTAPLR